MVTAYEVSELQKTVGSLSSGMRALSDKMETMKDTMLDAMRTELPQLVAGEVLSTVKVDGAQAITPAAMEAFMKSIESKMESNTSETRSLLESFLAKNKPSPSSDQAMGKSAETAGKKLYPSYTWAGRSTISYDST